MASESASSPPPPETTATLLMLPLPSAETTAPGKARRRILRRIAPDIETIIIPTSQEFAHISSSAVRDILTHNGDTSLFLPEGVVLPNVNKK